MLHVLPSLGLEVEACCISDRISAHEISVTLPPHLPPRTHTPKKKTKKEMNPLLVIITTSFMSTLAKDNLFPYI